MSLTSPGANAAWTGISLGIDEVEDDWQFEDRLRTSKTTRLNLHFEEGTQSGLLVGANIGRLTTRISNKSGLRETEKFDASYIGIYLAYPASISEQLTFHSQAGFQYHSGSEVSSVSSDKLSWRTASVSFGLGYRASNIRITPFVVISDVDGDIDREDRTDSFSNHEAISAGISLDIFVDPTSYVRLNVERGAGESFSLRFAREF